MPIELVDNVIATGSDMFTSQTVAGPGKVSYWAAVEGGDPMGNPVASQVMQQGIPFGHGSRKVIKGIKEAMVTGKDGKKRANILKGPSGREYVELEVDLEDMIEKQKWEGSVSNDRVKEAQGNATKNLDPNDPDIRASVTASSDQIQKLSDDEIDALAEKRLKEITAEHP